MIGVCWPWAQLRPNVVALANPLGIATNVRLTETDGSNVADQRKLLHLNSAVYAAPWQDSVCALLASGVNANEASQRVMDSVVAAGAMRRSSIARGTALRAA